MRRTRFGWLEFIIGILMVALGIFTWIKPLNAADGFIRVYGIMAIISGARDIVFYCKAERYTGLRPMISLTAGIVSLMAGITLLVCPNAGIMTVAVIFSIWFISHSIFQIASLERIKYFMGRSHYLIALVISIAGLLLGVLVLFHPFGLAKAVSVITGCYLVVTGIASIILAFSEAGFTH